MSDKAFVPITQEEAGYQPVSVSATQACSNCRFFYQSENGYTCNLIDTYPEPIVPNGICNRWEAGVMPEPEPMPVIAIGEVEFEMSELEERAASEELPDMPPGLFERIKAALVDLLREKPPVSVFKTLDDGKHWVAYYTNNFEDREREILSEKAHERYIARVKAGLVPKPELWFWHIPGTKHGETLWLDRIDNYMVAVGTFTDDAIGKAFSQHYRSTRKKYGNSHGFYADKSKHYQVVDGVGIFTDYNTFEITTLYPKAAANLFTMFTEIEPMAITPESAAALAGIIGKEAADQIIETALQASKAVKELGVQYKDLTDVDALETPAPDTAAIEAVSKNVAPLLLSMAESQGDLADVQKAQRDYLATLEKQFTDALVAAITPLQEQVSKQASEIASLQAQLSLTPRRASNDPTTAVPDTEAKQFEGRLPGKEFDDFFNDAGVPANTYKR